MTRIVAVLTSIATALLGFALAGPAQAADIVTTVGVGLSAQHVAVSPDGSTAYVTNRGADTVSVIDMATNAVTATIVAGDYPQDVVVTADGSRVFVANRDSNGISVINTATNAVVFTIPVAGGPDGLALSLDGSRLYVTQSVAGTLAAIDTGTLAVVGGVAVAAGPNSVAVSQDGAFAFVANRTANTLSVVALPALTVVTSVPVGPDPYWVVTRGRGSDIRAYVANFAPLANTVVEIGNTGGGWAVTRTLPVPGRPNSVELSADGKTLYVTQYTAGSVAAVDLSNGAITGTTAIAAGLVGIAVTPDGSRAVVVRFLPPETATILALAPRVALQAAQDVKGTTATGRATVTADTGAVSDIECLYSQQDSHLADPFDSVSPSVNATPATASAGSSTDVQCRFTGLERGRTYYFTALATDSDGTGAAMSPESFTTRPPKPARPEVTRKRKRLVLRWDATRTATFYQARIRKSGSYEGWRTVTQPKVKFKRLRRYTAYRMQIRAGNDSGVGPRRTLTRRTR